MTETKRIPVSRRSGFAVITLAYILSAILGIAVYHALPYGWQLNLLIADVAATVVTFVFSLLFKNASVYDPYWSVQPIVIVLALAAGQTLTPLRVMLIGAICLWGVRLTTNWAYTFHGLAHQDWRYTMLHKQTGAFYPIVNFLGIHLVPTLIVYGCVLPAAYAMLHDGSWNMGSAVSFCLSVAAIILQGTADFQMHRFRRKKTGGFIHDGLWKYSRHPNYLGEILMWWGVALAVICAFPEQWYLCAGAAANTVLFLTVSIPMADKRQSAKPGFAEYRRQTRMLLPFPKNLH